MVDFMTGGEGWSPEGLATPLVSLKLVYSHFNNNGYMKSKVLTQNLLLSFWGLCVCLHVTF